MVRRVDLLVEVDDELDGSGDYTGEWIDTGGIQRVRRIGTGGGAVPVTLQQSIDGVTPFGDDGWNNGEVKELTARYFRFVISGTPNQPFLLSIRVVD